MLAASGRTERDEQSDYASYSTCAWFIIVTMTTVGYSDLAPYDNAGRIVASISCVYGIIFLALVVTVITDNLGLNGQEANIINLVREESLRRNQTQAAAAFIQDIWLQRRSSYTTPCAVAPTPSAPAPRARLSSHPSGRDAHALLLGDPQGAAAVLRAASRL